MSDNGSLPSGLVQMLLLVLTICGYGLWMLLGLALALGIYSSGRGEALVPLMLGCVFVSVGPLLASLRLLPMMPDWYGWRFGHRQRPTRETLMLLATYLPMLGVAGLAHGDNDFWATRLVGATLMVCSLASVVLSAYGYRARHLPELSGIASQMPISRVVSAWYGGGLWLWLCVISQDASNWPGGGRPWILGLLLLALLLGLVEGMRWQALQSVSVDGREAPDILKGLQTQRFVAAALTYAIPCLSLLLAHAGSDNRWMALLAALACVSGKSLELHLFDIALHRRASHRES
ncbi:MAG: hypothetical protein WA777_04875 [Rhodanobacter sp.]